jgi:hypothetical protein
MRVVEDCAILDDDQVEEFEVGEGVPQIPEGAARVEDQLAAGSAKARQRGESGGIDSAIGGDGFVIVGGESLYVFQNSSQS